MTRFRVNEFYLNSFTRPDKCLVLSCTRPDKWSDIYIWVGFIPDFMTSATASKKIEFQTEKQMNQWMNEQINEWIKEWINEWVSEWMIEWINEWMSEWMNK